jgi:hypothetical protein
MEVGGPGAPCALVFPTLSPSLPPADLGKPGLPLAFFQPSQNPRRPSFLLPEGGIWWRLRSWALSKEAVVGFAPQSAVTMIWPQRGNSQRVLTMVDADTRPLGLSTGLVLGEREEGTKVSETQFLSSPKRG